MKPTKEHSQVNSTGSHPKSTYKAGLVKKAPTGQHKKALTGRTEKAPPYYISSGVEGVIGVDDLRAVLLLHRQHEWCSRVKLLGLMLLIEYFAKRRNPKGVSCSADLARGYVSKIGRPKSKNTTREPLAVLCQVELLRIQQTAINGWHVKLSALYAFHEDYAHRPVRRFDVALPPNLIKKREQATERYEKRLCQRHPFRAQLKKDLAKLSFTFSARSLIANFLRDPKLRKSTQTAVEAIDCQQHKVGQSPRGQITTSISSCPKPLK